MWALAIFIRRNPFRDQRCKNVEGAKVAALAGGHVVDAASPLAFLYAAFAPESDDEAMLPAFHGVQGYSGAVRLSSRPAREPGGHKAGPANAEPESGRCLCEYCCVDSLRCSLERPRCW